MSFKRPSLMEKPKFERLLANKDVEDIFRVMKNCRNYFLCPDDSAVAQERYNLAKARYVDLKLEQEDFDRSSAVEADLWRCLIEYELMRREETGRRFCSTRTRNAIRNDGILKAVAASVRRGRLTLGKTFLIDNDLPEYSFEKIILKHADFFDDERVIDKAKKSLEYYSNNRRKIIDAQ